MSKGAPGGDGGGNTSIPVRNGQATDYVVGLSQVDRMYSGGRGGDTMSDRRRRGVAKVTLANVVHATDKPPAYVGLDLSKSSLQAAVIDPKGNQLFNKKIASSRKSIARLFNEVPAGSWCVLESTSVWHGVYRFMTAELGLDIVVANPFQVRAIALSKKKTDENDAMMLARLLRSGDLPICYVPSEEAFQARVLVRHRRSLVEKRTFYKNKVHGVLLQEGIKISGQPFGIGYVAALRGLGDYRIDDYLDQIASINRLVAGADARIRKFVAGDSYSQRLMTIPGVGPFTAAVISAGAETVSRFPSAEAFAAYTGLVPTVRDSGNTQYHGRITKTGDRLMRYVLVECILAHVRLAPDSDIARVYNRIRNRKKGHSRAAVAAGARMARTMYAMLRDGRDFADHHSARPRARAGGRGK